ncbi:MAG: hypothetical protein COA82_08240 [Alkaliphilus sp.]|nr:MAG: hypothetical protein COA82_08240 [Alkaliphilus sp.]
MLKRKKRITLRKTLELLLQKMETENFSYLLLENELEFVKDGCFHVIDVKKVRKEINQDNNTKETIAKIYSRIDCDVYSVETSEEIAPSVDNIGESNETKDFVESVNADKRITILCEDAYIDDFGYIEKSRIQDFS